MLGLHSIGELSLGELLDEEIVFPVTFLHAEHRPVMIIGDNFYRAELGDDFAGTEVLVVLERKGWTIEGANRDGSLRLNPARVKLLREIWPVFRGTVGTIVNIYVGAQPRTPEDTLTYEGPYPFVIGQDVSVQPLVEGAFLAIKYTSIGQPPWDLLSQDLDIEPTGETL